MSERYFITGVQLGLLEILNSEKERKTIIDNIIDKQFIGNQSPQTKEGTLHGKSLQKDRTSEDTNNCECGHTKEQHHLSSICKKCSNHKFDLCLITGCACCKFKPKGDEK